MYQLVGKLFGFMLGDGWISVNKKFSTTLYSGFSGDATSLHNTIGDLNLLFQEDLKLKVCTRETFSEKYNILGTASSIYVPSRVGAYFVNLGMPTGKKVEKEFLLPTWLIHGDIDIKKSFISGLYCAEGLTPAMQRNDKTPRVLGFALTKRLIYEDNLNQLMSQIGDILTELEIEFSIRKEYTVTCDSNVKILIDFANNIDNILRVCNVLDLSYALDKQEKMNLLKYYLLYKKDILKNLDSAYREAIDTNNKATEIAKKFNLTCHQVRKWRVRRTGYRIPNNFPTLTEFNDRLFGPL